MPDNQSSLLTQPKGSVEIETVQAYLRGHSIRQIASEMGLTPWAVRNILRTRLTLRPRGGVNRTHKTRTALTYSIILRIKVDGATHAELCTTLRLSRNTVKRYWNSSYGKAVREFVFHERLGQSKREVIKRLRLERVPDSVIARTIGVSIAELRKSELRKSELRESGYRKSELQQPV